MEQYCWGCGLKAITEESIHFHIQYQIFSCSLERVNILPAGLGHSAASGLFTILYLSGLLVLLLRLPWGSTKEVADALLPGGCGAGAHGVATGIFVLCCATNEKESVSFLLFFCAPSVAVSRYCTDLVWSTGCWKRQRWLHWSPETSWVQRLQQLQTQKTRKYVSKYNK